MTHVPHPDEEQRKVCERLREPSQEEPEKCDCGRELIARLACPVCDNDE